MTICLQLVSEEDMPESCCCLYSFVQVLSFSYCFLKGTEVFTSYFKCKMDVVRFHALNRMNIVSEVMQKA